MDKKVQAALLFVLAVFIFMVGTRYGNRILHIEDPSSEQIVSPDNSSQQQENSSIPSIEKLQEIYVQVAGAVKKPGLYKLNNLSRVDDAVRLAEPLPKADINALNLAEKVNDGQKITVPVKGEKLPQDSTLFGQGKGSASSSSGTPSSFASMGNVVNINTANANELDSLPGIGPAYAARIVEYRTEHGAFQKIEDIQQVKGIGPKKFADLKERISVN